MGRKWTIDRPSLFTLRQWVQGSLVPTSGSRVWNSASPRVDGSHPAKGRQHAWAVGSFPPIVFGSKRSVLLFTISPLLNQIRILVLLFIVVWLTLIIAITSVFHWALLYSSFRSNQDITRLMLSSSPFYRVENLRLGKETCHHFIY